MGYSCVTTVLSPAASYALTDLATVHSELSIPIADTSEDAWLTRAIAQVSWGIGSYIKRVLAPETVSDAFDIEQDPYPYQTPGGFPQLQLSRWPVLGLVSVIQTLTPPGWKDGAPTPGTYQTLYAGRDFRLDPKTGRILRLNRWTGVGTMWEALPVTVVYTAGYGALVVETDTVPSAAPYQITVSQAATYSCTQSAAYASGDALTLASANPAQGQFSVTQGVYAFNAADAGQALTLTYATAAIPADIVDATLQLITARYAAWGRDPALIQEDIPNVGTKRWWFGGEPGQKGPFPPDVAAILDTYRMPTIA